MELHRNEKGQMLVMTAIELFLLIGFLALATDVGVLFHSKRQLQIAADAAATAAAMNQLDDTSTGSTLAANTFYAACLAVANNGYGKTTDCSSIPGTTFTKSANTGSYSDSFTMTDGTSVTVNTPPVNGYHESSGYVEAIVAKSNPLYFFKVFTGNKTAAVAARAVAGSPGASKDCAYLMDPTGVDMQLQGNATINSPGCTWYINSDGSAAGETVHQTGGSATVNAPYVASYGTAGVSTLGGAPVYSNVLQDTPPPMQEVGVVPSSTTCDQTYAATSPVSSSNPTGFPTTIDGSKADGSGGVVCFTGTNVDISGETLKNGIFVFENGVQAGNPTGSTQVSNGVIEVYGGTFTQNSNSVLNISSPCSAKGSQTPSCGMFDGLSYNGVALLVPAANTTYDNKYCLKVKNGTLKNQTDVLTVQIGSSNQSFDGYIVAPNADVFLNDNGGSVAITGLIAACMHNKSSTLTITNYNTAHPLTSPMRYVALVE